MRDLNTGAARKRQTAMRGERGLPVGAPDATPGKERGLEAMSSAAENRKIIEEFYAAFFAGDFEAGLKHWADELTIVEVASLPYAGSYRGREQWLDLFGRLMSTWTDLSLSVDDLLVSDTRVAAYGTFSAKSTKTGKPVEFPMVEVWELRDGKIVGCVPVYGDTHMVVEALR